jgi:hypothetical protein
MIFFDAAGLSNPRHEPYIVIAGVVIHGDRQWKPLADYLAALADKYAPPEHRDGFVFHATELFSGGKIFPRDKYPKEWRWKVLDELMSIPEKFGLPIVWGHVPRSEVMPGGSLAASDFFEKIGVKPHIQGQMLAFTMAASVAEQWMRLKAGPSEIAAMFMEDDHESRMFLKVVQRLITDPKKYGRFAPEFEPFKLTKIIYPIHFELKTDSSALQVADVAAFAIKRKCMGTPEADRFYKPLEPFLVNKLKVENAKPSEEAAK